MNRNPSVQQPPAERKPDTLCEICMDYFDDPADVPEGTLIAGACDRHCDGQIVAYRGYLCDMHIQDLGFVEKSFPSLADLAREYHMARQLVASGKALCQDDAEWIEAVIDGYEYIWASEGPGR